MNADERMKSENSAPAVTHIVLEFKSQHSELIFRAADGLAIGQQKARTVVFGVEPNRKTSRVFMDEDHARRFLRNVIPQMDLNRQGVFDPDYVDFGPFRRDRVAEQQPERFAEVEIRDGEPLIQLPADAMELPGGIRNFN